MPARETLFLLAPGFDDHDQLWFCPWCAQVVGFLTYYPEVRRSLDIVELAFPRPRHGLVELVGEANQGCPCLVLADDARPAAIEGVTVHEYENHRFVSQAIQIVRYLATTRGTPLPH